jgi:hypothetical protein
VESPDRAHLLARLQEGGVPTAIYYPIPLHLQAVFQDLGYKTGDFPASEAAAARIFSLPMHPYLAPGRPGAHHRSHPPGRVLNMQKKCQTRRICGNMAPAPARGFPGSHRTGGLP